MLTVAEEEDIALYCYDRLLGHVCWVQYILSFQGLSGGVKYTYIGERKTQECLRFVRIEQNSRQ